jgi:hypothetical protein
MCFKNIFTWKYINFFLIIKKHKNNINLMFYWDKYIFNKHLKKKVMTPV